MTTDIHTENDDPDEDFEQYIEETVEVFTRVQKPMDEVMDAQGSYETALRTEVGTGEIAGFDVTIEQPMGGGIWVKFEEPDIFVKFGLRELVEAAFAAGARTEYIDDPTDEEDDDD